jgi:hypothetical protein
MACLMSSLTRDGSWVVTIWEDGVVFGDGETVRSIGSEEDERGGDQ